MCVCVCANDVTLSMEQWVNYCGSLSLNKDGTSGISLCAHGEIGLLNWTQKHVRHWINIWMKSSRCGTIEVGLSLKPKTMLNKKRINWKPKVNQSIKHLECIRSKVKVDTSHILVGAVRTQFHSCKCKDSKCKTMHNKLINIETCLWSAHLTVNTNCMH